MKKGSVENTSPLLTVITVVYNAVDTIEQTICSVIEQDYENIEYIIIDGGSTDGTLEIINKYSAHIDIIVSEKDQGIYDAMNKAIRLANGLALNFMNAGDYFYPNIIKEYAELFLDKKTIAVTGHTELVDLEGYHCGFITFPLNSLLLSVPCHQAFFIHRDVFKKFGGFDTSYSIAADYKLLLYTIYTFGIDQFKMIGKPTVGFLAGGVSTREAEKSTREHERIRYEIFGKELGLSYDFFYRLPEDVSKLLKLTNYLFQRECDNPKHEQLKCLLLVAALFWIEPQYHGKINNLSNAIDSLEKNWWYKFGQSKKRDKVKLLCRYILKKLYHIHKRRVC